MIIIFLNFARNFSQRSLFFNANYYYLRFSFLYTHCQKKKESVLKLYYKYIWYIRTHDTEELDTSLTK